MLFDIGGTIVTEADPATPVSALVPHLLPDVVEDLGTLAPHVRIGAVTNTATMGEADVRALLREAGVDGFFEVLVTSADVGRPKPDPATLLVALERLGGIDPERTCYVGDRVTDEEAARAAGMAFAPVTEGGLLDALGQWLSTQGV